jgi:hypothetical protein
MPRVKHVALVRFKKEMPPGKLKEIFAAVGRLRDTIPGLLDYSGGPYSSPEGLNQGFDHGFVMTFEDEASRNAYLTHPSHEVVKDMIIPWLDNGLQGVIAFDWMDAS